MALDVVAVSEVTTTNQAGALVVTLSVGVTGYGNAMRLAGLLSQSVNVANMAGEVVETALVGSVGAKYYPADNVVEGTARVIGGPALQRVVGKMLRLEAAQLGMDFGVEKAVEELRPKKGSGIDEVKISDPSTGRSATLKARE